MDSFWDKVKKGAQEAGEKAGILAKIGKLQAEIAGINTSKSGKLTELGKQLYSLYKEGKLGEEVKQSLLDFLKPIEEAEKTIEQKEKEILELKKQMGESKEEAPKEAKEEKTEEQKPEEKNEEQKPEPPKEATPEEQKPEEKTEGK